MRFFALFIYRPVATILIAAAITLCGILGFRLLPVAPLPQVDFPVIMVSASLPGASPETMASSVATPLERSLGRIAGVNEMTSSSSLGSTRIILEFNFDRDINGAARDVQAAINAAQSLLPGGMPSRPTYRKANPSDAPIMILTLTSESWSQGKLYDFASTQLAQTIAQIDGVGDVDVGGSSLPAVRVGLNPQALFNQGVSLDEVREAIDSANVRRPQGAIEDSVHRWQIQTNDELKTAAEYQPLIIHYNNGAAVRLGDVASVTDSVQDVRNAGMTNAKPAILLMIRKLPEYYSDGRRHPGKTAGTAGNDPRRYRFTNRPGSFADDSRIAARGRRDTGYLCCAGDPGGVFIPALRARHANSRRRRSRFAHRHLRRHVSVRLQPQQSVADGADYRDRICR